jgi:hypothetical protein
MDHELTPTEQRRAKQRVMAQRRAPSPPLAATRNQAAATRKPNLPTVPERTNDMNSELQKRGKHRVMDQLRAGKSPLEALRTMAATAWTNDAPLLVGAINQALAIVSSFERNGTKLNFPSEFGRRLFKNGSTGACEHINRFMNERDVIGLAESLTTISSALTALQPHTDIEAWTRSINERPKEIKRTKITRDANLEAREIVETTYEIV